MDATFIVIAGIAVFANFAFLKVKFDNSRFADLGMDLFIITLLSFLFAGTMGGLAIAMIGGFLISIYLWFSPPKMPEEVIGHSYKIDKDKQVGKLISSKEYQKMVKYLQSVDGFRY